MTVYLWIAILVVIFVCSSGLEENATEITVSSPVSELGSQICTHKDHAIATLQGIVSCNNGNFSVIDCYCATYNTREELLEVGACIFNCESYNSDTKSTIDFLYLNDELKICGSFNRTGTLCGRCLDGQYVSAYSFNLECKRCDNVVRNWFLYIMAAYLPLTLFYFVVLFFKVNVASGYLHPVVVFSQAITAPPLARVFLKSVNRNPVLLHFTEVFGSFYGIWSLDFFRPFYNDLCLGIGILPTLALDYVIAVYPLLLMIISYLLIVLYDRNYRVVTIMWKPFLSLFSLFRRNWDIRTSVIDAYATFFLLSYIKFLSTSFDLLAPTKIYLLHGNYNNSTNSTWALYYAGDVEYFGKEHLPYGILAIAVMCVFVILPTVTLALYPFTVFQKFLNLFPFRWHILHMFMDSFQGCYKNGTEPGTHDYRWFSVAYLVLRLICYISFGLTLSSVFYPLCSLLIFFFIIILAIFQPYKTSLHFRINVGLLSALTSFFIASSGYFISGVWARVHNLSSFFYVVAAALGLVPLFFVVILIFHGLISRWKFFLKLVFRFRSWCQRHKSLDDSAAETVDSDRVVNPQGYPAIPMRRYNSLVDLLKED